MMASATLGDALCLALRYMPLLQGNVEISLLREDEQVILRLLPGPAPRRRCTGTSAKPC